MSLAGFPMIARPVLRILLSAFFYLALEKHETLHLFNTPMAAKVSKSAGIRNPHRTRNTNRQDLGSYGSDGSAGCRGRSSGLRPPCWSLRTKPHFLVPRCSSCPDVLRLLTALRPWVVWIVP